jgi:5-methylcytosine-specific restriction endonuclease McrA
MNSVLVVPKHSRPVVRVANSVKLQTFKYKGLNCVSCHRVGHFFAIEKQLHSADNVKNYGLQLYCEDGVLMTVDHKIPKAKGGKDTLENLQPMCVLCNQLKADK